MTEPFPPIEQHPNYGKIAILLATYNSHKFICEQLDSIYSQTYNNVFIYIRDDGSTDNTIEIIDSYRQKYSNIFILNDNIKNRGTLCSFMWLLEHVDANYYMFCDHDDVWLPQKIEISLKKMETISNRNSKVPIIVCSDLVVVDEHLKIINNSFWDYMKLRPSLLSQKKYIYTCNFVTGCTMLINRKAKDVSFPFYGAIMHDSWISLRVIENDGIINYISKPLVLYRQHGNNVFGAKKVGGAKYIWDKIILIKNVIQTNMDNYKMAKQASQINIFSYIYRRILYLVIRNFIKK